MLIVLGVSEGGLRMKKYIIPRIMCVELRTEENIAIGKCTGSCTDAQAAAWNAEEGTDYYIAHGS